MAGAGHETLAPEAAVTVLEELFEAQNQAYFLGLKLQLPPHVVDGICKTYLQPREQLLHVIITFLNQVEPRPTWRMIVDALKSPVVGLLQLAERIEREHFPSEQDHHEEATPQQNKGSPHVVEDNINDSSSLSDTAPTRETAQDHPTTVKPLEHVVFCQYKDDKGCEWQGKPSDLEHHLQSCPMKELPPPKTTNALKKLSKTTVPGEQLISRGGTSDHQPSIQRCILRDTESSELDRGIKNHVTKKCKPVNVLSRIPLLNFATEPPKTLAKNGKCFIDIDKSESLGSGLFGEVYKAKYNGLICAVKIMHTTKASPNSSDSPSYISRLNEVCDLIGSVKHPHVVQHFATISDPTTQLPTLVMELCDERLTSFLDKAPLQYHIELNISHDIALALVYLHSNGIIHSNLTGNNVLIVSGPRAKVADFGMYRLAAINPCNQRYMPPEALEEPITYTDTIDLFSFGVILIQILTRQRPKPIDHFQLGQFLYEAERRQEHISLISDSHSLKPLALQCLSARNERPTASEINERLSGFKEELKYAESVHHAQSKSEIQQLQNLLEKQKVVAEFKTKEAEEYQLLSRQLQGLVKSKENELSMKMEALERKEKELQQMKLQFATKTQLVAEFQQSTHKKDTIITNLRNTLSAFKMQLEEQVKAPPPPLQSTQTADSVPQKDITSMRWSEGKSAPITMFRGAAVVHNNKAYFRAVHSHRVLAYENIKGNEQWTLLPKHQNKNFGLAVVEGNLTTVGGSSNTLFSLLEDNEWIELYPPMPTQRSEVTCITTEKNLIVAGGSSDFETPPCLDTVEVMNIDTKQWNSVTSLPIKGLQFSGVVYHGKLYLAGGNHSTLSKSVFTCSLEDLLSCNEHELKWRSACQKKVWHEIESLPEAQSTLATLGGHLVAIGGNLTANFYRYNFDTNEWCIVSKMKYKRASCLAVTLPEDRLIVVGGYSVFGKETDSVEILQ